MLNLDRGTRSKNVALLLAVVAPFYFSAITHAGEVPVTNGVELQNALKSASPGDEIVLYPGDYFGQKGTSNSGSNVGHFYSDRDGTSSNPIKLRSASASNKQVMKGDDVYSGYIFLLKGDHWEVSDLKFRTAQKGIMLEGANHNKFNNIEVWDTGAEAVHFRRFSSNNELTNCYIHDTGKRAGQEGFGEGVYVGTHDGHLAAKLDNSNNNRIGGCHIGPNVTAESFDVKAGTTGTVIESNYLDGRGIIGTADTPNANSFIDLKGDRNIVRGNIMDYRGETNIEHSIQTSDEHQTSNAYDNTYTLPSSTYTYNLQDETLHLNNENRTDGGTQIVRKSYQEDHYDFNLDNSIEQPYNGPYPCFDELTSGCGSNTSGGGDTGGGDTGGGDTGGGDTGGGDTGGGDTGGGDTGGGDTGGGDTGGGDTGGGSCASVALGDRAEIVLSTSNSCVTFTTPMSGKRLAVWDSDTNPSCNFRGTVDSVDGSGSIVVDGNYENSSSMSGTTIQFTQDSANPCDFVKVRLY